MSKCGCYAQQARYTDELEVVYCPLHKAAPELLDAIAELRQAVINADADYRVPVQMKKASAAIKKAEGKA